MSEQEQSSSAEKFGNYLGRCWKGYSRILDRFSRCLQHMGVPYVLCRMIGVGLQAVVLIILLYVAFWITLIAICLFVRWATGVAIDDERTPQWRDGPDGFGYYEGDTRIDYGEIFDDLE